jgi:hypothetical protein
LEFTQAELISIFMVVGGLVLIASAKQKAKQLNTKTNG